MNQSEQINELAAALAKAQGAMKNAVMNKVNPHFKSKYADLSSVIDAIKAPLSASGLSYSQTMHITERGMVLRTILMHASSGQYLASEYPLANPLEPQKFGSSLTYAKRYSLASIVGNASDEDDDGNAAATSKPANVNTDRLDQHQRDQIVTICDEIGAGTLNALCKYKNIASIGDLPRSEFAATVAALNRKKAQAATQEAAE